MIADCTAIILAGGDSKRMGRDKAALLMDGQTLLERVTLTMQSVFPQVMVSVRQPREGVSITQVCDKQKDGGPLLALISALETVATPWVFVVACDMPFITPEVVRRLASRRGKHQAVVPRVGGHPQPLAAFYATGMLGTMRASWESGDGSLRGMLQRLDVRYVDEAELRECDPQLRSFFDLDTPQDYQLAVSKERDE